MAFGWAHWISEQMIAATAPDRRGHAMGLACGSPSRPGATASKGVARRNLQLLVEHRIVAS